jgi:ribosomal protein L13
MIGKLKVYAGPEHPHSNHRPRALDLAAWPRVQALENEPAES